MQERERERERETMNEMRERRWMRASGWKRVSTQSNRVFHNYNLKVEKSIIESHEYKSLEQQHHQERREKQRYCCQCFGELSILLNVMMFKSLQEQNEALSKRLQELQDLLTTQQEQEETKIKESAAQYEDKIASKLPLFHTWFELCKVPYSFCSTSNFWCRYIKELRPSRKTS